MTFLCGPRNVHGPQSKPLNINKGQDDRILVISYIVLYHLSSLKFISYIKIQPPAFIPAERFFLYIFFGKNTHPTCGPTLNPGISKFTLSEDASTQVTNFVANCSF